MNQLHHPGNEFDISYIWSFLDPSVEQNTFNIATVFSKKQTSLPHVASPSRKNVAMLPEAAHFAPCNRVYISVRGVAQRPRFTTYFKRFNIRKWCFTSRVGHSELPPSMDTNLAVKLSCWKCLICMIIGEALVMWVCVQVVDMPLLFEVGAYRYTSSNIVVHCSAETQVWCCLLFNPGSMRYCVV